MEHDYRRRRVHQLQFVHARGHGRIHRQRVSRLLGADAQARPQVDRYPAERARANPSDRHRLRADHVQPLRQRALRRQRRRRNKKTRRRHRADRSRQSEGAQGSGRRLPLWPQLVERGIAAAAGLDLRRASHRPGLETDARAAIVPDRRHARGLRRRCRDGKNRARAGARSHEARSRHQAPRLLQEFVALLKMLYRRLRVDGGKWRRRLRRGRGGTPAQGRRHGGAGRHRQLRRLQIRSAGREFRRIHGRNQVINLPDPTIPLVYPQLGALYQTLAPVTDAALRVMVGLALVPHALRNTFGCFPTTGQPMRSVRMLAVHMDKQGYRPGIMWAPAISLTQLICGPLLALGLFTRLAALPIVLFLLVSNIERWRVGKYFWNQLGLEYTLMWTVAALYFLVHGGGTYSLDNLIMGREF